MFRIDKRNVKIADAPVNTLTGADKREKDGGPLQSEPSAFMQQTETGLTAEQEALVAAQLEAIELSRWDIDAQVTKQREEIERMRQEAEREREKATMHSLEAEQQSRKALERMQAEADAVLQDAHRQAEEILEKARARADAEALEIRGDAWKAGFAEGREEAEKQAFDEGERLAQDLKTLTDGIKRGHEEQIERYEKDIVDLSLAIAKKIVNVAIKKDDIMFESLIKNALNQMKREGKLSIRLSDEDCARLFPDGSASFVLGGQTVTAAAVADPSLKQGDCILESDAEMVDASAGAQIRAITLAFEKLGDES